MSLSRDSLACWVHSVEESRLTQAFHDEREHKQLQRTLRRFLTPRSHTKIVASSFSTPKLLPSNNLSRGRIPNMHPKKQNHRATKLRLTKRTPPRITVHTLFKHGFVSTRNSLPTKWQCPPKQLADGAAKKTDFSGTLVSTSP
jgi:hypothetical protein